MNPGFPNDDSMTGAPSGPAAERISAPCEAILESISDGVFTVDDQWRITSFNRAAEAITGIPREEAMGRPCSEVLRSSMCEGDCALGRTLTDGRPVIHKTCYIIDAGGRRIPISVSTAVLRDADGRVIGGAETFRDLSDVEALRKELEGRFQVGDLVSRSPAMRQSFDLILAAADTGSTVLIQGETGTGKELAARAIHGSGPRSSEPFVAVNCAALPDTLLESELFGYKKGAFTGAGADKPGRLALAGSGTLFLDEIGDVSPAFQARLLRVMQERRYEALGGTRSEEFRARIIVATHRDLASLVASGDFREDLFYRINVLRIDLPPLRRREEDIPALVAHFVRRFNRLQEKDVQGVTPEVLSLLMSHDWPGNVRELENLVERAFVLCRRDRDHWIDVAQLPEEWRTRGGAMAAPKGEGEEDRDSLVDMASTRRRTEANLILGALERHGFHRAAAARELGIHKATLYRKIRELGIALPEKDGRSNRMGWERE